MKSETVIDCFWSLFFRYKFAQSEYENYQSKIKNFDVKIESSKIPIIKPVLIKFSLFPTTSYGVKAKEKQRKGKKSALDHTTSTTANKKREFHSENLVSFQTRT